MPLGHRLTWRRKPKGTTACRESGECPKTCRARPCKTRVIWRKPDCLTPQFPGMQCHILRHHVSERSRPVYQLAFNLYQLARVKWMMQDSLAKTLSAKLHISVGQVYRRLRTIIHTPRGPRRVFRVIVEREGRKRPLVATWGAVPLVRPARPSLHASSRSPRPTSSAS